MNETARRLTQTDNVPGGVDYYVSWLQQHKKDLKQVLISLEGNPWNDGCFDLVNDRGGRTTRVKQGKRKGSYIIEGEGGKWYPIKKSFVAAMYLEQLRTEKDLVANNQRLVDVADQDLNVRWADED